MIHYSLAAINGKNTVNWHKSTFNGTREGLDFAKAGLEFCPKQFVAERNGPDKSCDGFGPVDACLLEMMYEASLHAKGNPPTGVPAPPNNDPLKYGYSVATEPPEH